MRKRQRFRRVSRVIPALVLVFVMFFSMIPSIQVSAAGDDVVLHDSFRNDAV